MRLITERSVYARELVWRMYRDAADEDYLVARWSARNELHFQFYWSAQQALEKYMKGVLLMNGFEVKSFGHDLLTLFHVVREVLAHLVPSIFCPPRGFPRGASFMLGDFEPIESFITRFNDFGDPGNRYRHYSIVYYGYDLHKFDELCFCLRRAIFPLEMPFAGTDRSYRRVLTEEPNFQPHGNFPLFRRKKNEKLAECLLSLKWKNFSYYEDEAREAGSIHTGVFSTNSEITLNLERGTEGREALEWFLANARLSASDRQQLRELLDKQQA